MSDAAETELRNPNVILPGCGLAAYTGILAVMFIMGITGLFFWTWTVLAANEGAAFGQLSYGGNISPGLLIPMQQAGILQAWEVPDAYHAEDMGGDSACAILGSEFIRLSSTEKIRFPMSQITSVKMVEGPTFWPLYHTVGVEVAGPVTATCWFAEGTGEDRLLRILQEASGNK